MSAATQKKKPPIAKKGYQTGVILAGGTGGHITPGIALALELQKRGIDVHILSLSKNKSYQDFAHLDIKIHFYDMPPLPRGWKGLLVFPWKLFQSLLYSLAFFRKHSIHFAVGMGGYSMAAGLLAATILSKPYYLCESNARPGLATILFARRARKIFVNFPIAQELSSFSSLSSFRGKIIQVGTPIRPAICHLLNDLGQYPQTKGKKRKKSPTPSAKICHILALGGSQGAVQINGIVSQIILAQKKEQNEARAYFWTVQCGEKNLNAMKKNFPKEKFPNLKLIGYENAIEKYYSQADILICRAGSSVLSEALCFGIPLLLVPYPYSKGEHQKANAQHLASKGAAICFFQKDTDFEKIRASIQELQLKPQKREKMIRVSYRLAQPKAAEKITSMILS